MWKCFFLLFALGSCAWGPDSGETVLTVLSWNVQNLFDDIADGGEYPEFDPAKGYWNRAQFWRRCEKAAAVILETVPGGPDIVALQEVENINTARTLCDRFLSLRGYRVVMLPEPRCAVQTVFLTKIPPGRPHTLRLPDFEGEPLRPILEMEVEAGGQRIVLFNNHWKSRQPSPERTLPSRQQAGRLLSERAAWHRSRDAEVFLLAVGDFNSELNGGESPEGWILREQGLGTYFYRDRWEMLDHCLSYGSDPGVSVTARVWSSPSLLNSQNRPRRYSLQDKNGVSDHLPILVRLVIAKNVRYTRGYGIP